VFKSLGYPFFKTPISMFHHFKKLNFLDDQARQTMEMMPQWQLPGLHEILSSGGFMKWQATDMTTYSSRE
jgi:hypothetical protein